MGMCRGASGRILYLEKMTSDYTNKVSVKGPEAVAQYWLSTEADAIKWAAGQMMLWLDSHPEIDCELSNFCHDEINATASERDAYVCAEKLKDLMDQGMRLFSPYTNDTDIESMIVNNLSEK